MIDMSWIFSQLNCKQREVCTSSENYVLSACPGSGKTRTLTYRLAYLSEVNRPSRKLNIAITYTNRAADEIDSRLSSLNIDMSTVWTGTIHQFCLHFILRPYSMYSPRLCKGFRIIDEFIQDEYLYSISNKLGISCGYKSPLLFPEIKQQYDKELVNRREVDFDLILSLSMELLDDHPFISENISVIIRSIHVDEYQDTTDLQYQIVAHIVKKQKDINVFFVGDENQAIYGGLGGVAKSAEEIRSLFGINFKHDYLHGCYRSSTRIIDYYMNFAVTPIVIESTANIDKLKSMISYDFEIDKKNLALKIADIISTELSLGTPENEICVVAPQWQHVYSMANQLRILLPKLQFDAPDITPFKYDPMNPFYILAELFFSDTKKGLRLRKKRATELLNILRDDFLIPIEERFDAFDMLKLINSVCRKCDDGIAFYKCGVEFFLRALNVNLSEEKELNELFQKFVNKAKMRIEKHKLPLTYDDFKRSFKRKEGVVLSTIHGIKGNEFISVIGFGLLNGYLPNWQYIWQQDQQKYRNNEAKRLLYVMCSRAKVNLYLFSESGHKTKNGTVYGPTDELIRLRADYYDCIE